MARVPKNDCGLCLKTPLCTNKHPRYTLQEPPYTKKMPAGTKKRPRVSNKGSKISYSVLKLFTGFANAALIAWKLTVINVIISAPVPETIKTQNDTDVLYSYCCSQ